ncbi:hypothetical protein PoB_005608200 [Plakobranchus ocellatus]|uniref:Uncharacterized protein n=1 Tax=Plakobranchus ocellatus TaxID=259542 RepID=A0AAV4CDK1_9GAST|nr:hypothetical protein PoB_005608200 [Plakobranchus ocellatus]
MLSLRIQSAVNICRQTKFRLSDNYKLCGLVHGFPLTAPVVMDIPASPQQGNVRLTGLASGQGAGGGARTRSRRVPEGSLQISGRIYYPLCHRRPKAVREQRPD